MTARRLARNRLALVLLLVLPTTFFAVIWAVTPARSAWVELASVPAEVLASPLTGPTGAGSGHGVPVRAPERSLGLVFVALAAVGIVAAFLGLTLVQRSFAATRRLVLCGYRPWEVLAARAAALQGVVAAVAAMVGASLLLLLEAEQPETLLAGLLLVGWVYGAYGLLAGSLARDELVGILLIVLLAVVDAGWLQHPAVFADAPAKLLIRALPGHLPAQVAFVGAFSQYGTGRQAAGALAYGAALLAAAAVAFALRARVRRGRR